MACGVNLSPDKAGRTTIYQDHNLLEVATEANPHNARQLRVRFQEWLQALGAPTALVDDLSLAVYEALANAVEHAYPAHHPNPMMHLQARLDHGQLLITISDHGCWRTTHDTGYRGRGLTVMRYLTSEVDIRPTANGTTVHMRAALNHNYDSQSSREPIVAPWPSPERLDDQTW
ncbi:MAG: ATP-binding protein [Actinomycetota bacterium]|nr:ATP-binding protein [Actinomycetota bacterium]